MARPTTKQRPQAARSAARQARHKPGRRLPWPWLVLGMALVPAAIGVMFALGHSSGDGGKPIAILRTSDFHALAFSPDNPNVVFFGHHNGLMRSDDGGRTWRPVIDRPNFDAMSLTVNPRDPRQIFLAGHDVFLVSTDGGASWQPVKHNLPGTDIHGFALNPDEPSRLYAFVVGYGLFTSADGGRTWQKLSTQLPMDVMALASAGGSPETIYAGSMGAGVLKSTDGGLTWAPSNAGLRSWGVMALAVNPVARQVVYAGAEDGLYRSNDAGASWRKLSFPGRNVIAIAVSPSDPQIVLAIEGVRRGEGRLYRSTDGGATWDGGRGR